MSSLSSGARRRAGTTRVAQFGLSRDQLTGTMKVRKSVRAHNREATELSDYEPLDLASSCNAGLEIFTAGRRPPTGDQMIHGLPFLIGDPAKPESPCFVRVMPGESVT